MAARRRLWWLSVPLLFVVCVSSPPRLIWACKTVAPGTSAEAARASLAATGAYCNDFAPEVWTRWEASPGCACHLAANRSGVVTEVLSVCASGPAALKAACDAAKVGDRLGDDRKALDATGYPPSTRARGFACYVTFVVCGVEVDSEDRVTDATLAWVRR